MILFDWCYDFDAEDNEDCEMTDEEAEIVAFRTLKCLDRNERLDECIKTDKYGIKINHMNKVFYINKELYDEYDKSGIYDVHILRNPVNEIFKDSKGEYDFSRTEVYIIFKNE